MPDAVPNRLRCVSPADGNIYVERDLTGQTEIDAALAAARLAQRDWRRVSIGERQRIILRAVDAFVEERDVIAEEISGQMGRLDLERRPRTRRRNR
jgi:acyl-CoA reductase-like NAD-dependent aldehyde dehydrogenase